MFYKYLEVVWKLGVLEDKVGKNLRKQPSTVEIQPRLAMHHSLTLVLPEPCLPFYNWRPLQREIHALKRKVVGPQELTEAWYLFNVLLHD